MDDNLRSCRRPGCGWPATASLSFRYATGQVWLQDLSPTPDPSLYDLCASHADTQTVPRGWEQVDERTPGAHEVAIRRPLASPPAKAAPVRDPVGAGHSAGHSAGRAGHSAGDAAPGRPEGGHNRYERLSRELPKLAARLAAEVAEVSEVARVAEGSDEQRRPQPVASRDLARASFGGTLSRRRSA